MEDFACNHVSPRDIGRTQSGLLHELEHEGITSSVGQRVGGTRRDNFPAQAVLTNFLPVILLKRSWEIGDQVFEQVGIVRYIGGHDLVIEPDLGIRQHDRDFRPRQSAPGKGTLVNRLVVGQIFHRPVKPPLAFKKAHHSLVIGEAIYTLVFDHGHGLGLAVVVDQNQLPHFVGHFGQQGIA